MEKKQWFLGALLAAALCIPGGLAAQSVNNKTYCAETSTPEVLAAGIHQYAHYQFVNGTATLYITYTGNRALIMGVLDQQPGVPQKWAALTYTQSGNKITLVVVEDNKAGWEIGTEVEFTIGPDGTLTVPNGTIFRPVKDLYSFK